MKKLFILLATIVATIISIDAYAQQTVTVTGRVVYYEPATNEYEPVIGASVIVEGTTNGTITDLDGCFTLTIYNYESGKTEIIISFIGFTDFPVVIKGISINGKIDLGTIILNEDSVSLTDNIAYTEPTNLAISNRP